MKKINYRKFVFGFSLIALIGGFFSNYFSEPTREEKVLRALNYDLRFTEKIADHEPKRKPTSENSKLNRSHFGKNTELDHVFAADIYKMLEREPKTELEGDWMLVTDTYAIKNLGEEHQSESFTAFRGYFFFKGERELFKSYQPELIYKLVFNKRTRMIGLMTGTLSLKLTSGTDKELILREYQLNQNSYFENSNLLLATPMDLETVNEIYKNLKLDSRIEKVNYEIIYRFVEKR